MEWHFLHLTQHMMDRIWSVAVHMALNVVTLSEVVNLYMGTLCRIKQELQNDINASFPYTVYMLGTDTTGTKDFVCHLMLWQFKSWPTI